jgi:hypothetical protein
MEIEDDDDEVKDQLWSLATGETKCKSAFFHVDHTQIPGALANILARTYRKILVICKDAKHKSATAKAVKAALAKFVHSGIAIQNKEEIVMNKGNSIVFVTDCRGVSEVDFVVSFDCSDKVLREVVYPMIVGTTVAAVFV